MIMIMIMFMIMIMIMIMIIIIIIIIISSSISIIIVEHFQMTHLDCPKATSHSLLKLLLTTWHVAVIFGLISHITLPA